MVFDLCSFSLSVKNLPVMGKLSLSGLLLVSLLFTSRFIGDCFSPTFKHTFSGVHATSKMSLNTVNPRGGRRFVSNTFVSDHAYSKSGSRESRVYSMIPKNPRLESIALPRLQTDCTVTAARAPTKKATSNIPSRDNKLLSSSPVVDLPMSFVSCPLSKSKTEWMTELGSDVARDYILHGVSEGFDILEGKVPQFNADCKNYRSATCQNRLQTQETIRKELLQDNYKIVHWKPAVISALGAIPKSKGKIRLIHDLSRPNLGVNQFVEYSSCSYASVDYATSLMQQNCWLCKIDLKAAYRSIPIHPRNYQFTGLSWTFDHEKCRTYMVDTKLPFGSKKACLIFSTISDAVARILRRKGVSVVNYLDDLLLISNSKDQSWLDLDTSVNLLTRLGFSINWDKVVPPSQKLTFLGVELDSIKRTLALPPSKLSEFISLIDEWTLKKRCSKKELLSLLGKLNWASRVVRGGRTFLRRLIDLSKKLKQNNHRTWICREAHLDIMWWAQGISVFHGKTRFVQDYVEPEAEFITDACLVGGGGHFDNQWFYTNFSVDHPESKNEHINCLELLTVLVGARRWGHLWTNKHIRVRSDNEATVKSINKGTSHSALFMKYLRELFWLSEKYRFRLTALHIRGEVNFLADRISRLHNPRVAESLLRILSPVNLYINCFFNMSYGSFLTLQAFTPNSS